MNPFPPGVHAAPVDQCSAEHDKPRQQLFAADLLTFEKAEVSVECLPADDDFLIHVTITRPDVEAVGFVLDAQDAAGLAAVLAGACAAQLAAMNDAAQGDLFDPPSASAPPAPAEYSPAPPIGAGAPSRLCRACGGSDHVTEMCLYNPDRIHGR